MKTKSADASVSHDNMMIARIKRNPEFAVEYLKVAHAGHGGHSAHGEKTKP